MNNATRDLRGTRGIVGLCAIYAMNGAAAETGAVDLGMARLVQTMLALAGVVALIFVLAYLARRFQRIPQGGGALKIVDALPLGARERILLIEADGERLLIALAAGRIDALHVLGQRALMPASFHASLQALTATPERRP